MSKFYVVAWSGTLGRWITHYIGGDAAVFDTLEIAQDSADACNREWYGVILGTIEIKDRRFQIFEMDA